MNGNDETSSLNPFRDPDNQTLNSHARRSGSESQASTVTISPAQHQDNLVYEAEILADYDFNIDTDNDTNTTTSTTASNTSPLTTAVQPAYSRTHATRVLIKRYSKTNPTQLAAAQRDLDASHVLGGKDNTLPPLLDYFDPATTVFIIHEDRPAESLRTYIQSRGPITSSTAALSLTSTLASMTPSAANNPPVDEAGNLLKALITQLMGALAFIFMNGFAHLKMDDETVFIDVRNGQVIIRDFQCAVKYGTGKTEGLYAAVRPGDDNMRSCECQGIWLAPEVTAARREGTEYNGRKAVIWSCGVVIYYMITGQLDKLSNLDHPAFANRRRTSSAVMPNATNETSTPPPPTQTDNAAPPPETSRRRLSLMGHRRRSSAANTPSSPSHSRKHSFATTIPTPQTLVSYPGNRLEYPNYARDIISKMLILNPLERAELIEVAAKVPKELVSKNTRPLMELAWLDYKDHVGPYAGQRLGAEEWTGGYTGYGDDTSSTYSGVSAVSQGFQRLFGRGSGW